MIPLAASAGIVFGAIRPRRPQHDGPLRAGWRQVHVLRLVPENASLRARQTPASGRDEEPQFVLFDRSAKGRRFVEQPERLVRRREAARAQLVGEVGGLEALVGEHAREGPSEGVAALFRHHVHDHAIGVGVGRDAARGNGHFFDRGGIELVAVVPRAVFHAHAVVRHFGPALAVEDPAARHDVLAGLHLVGAADVADAGHADGERGDRAEALRAARQRVEDLTGHDRLAADVGDVHNRARAGHGDRLGEASGAQLDVHVRREPGRDLDSFALDCGESYQRVRDAVCARSQLRNRVAAFTVGDHRTLLLDQRRARCRDGRTREHSTGIVFDDSRNPCVLSVGSRSEKQRGGK